MANIAVRKENGDKRNLPALAREWDPFRVMRELMHWDPITTMMPEWREQQMFEPAFDVKENKDAFEFKADLPGMNEKDVDVKLTENRLTISGKREQEKTDKSDTYYCYERLYGTFTRAFTLPDGVDADKISAEMKNGVLTLKLPKRPEKQPKKINVKAT